jgi:hypothetical protein
VRWARAGSVSDDCLMDRRVQSAQRLLQFQTPTKRREQAQPSSAISFADRTLPDFVLSTPMLDVSTLAIIRRGFDQLVSDGLLAVKP